MKHLEYTLLSSFEILADLVENSKRVAVEVNLPLSALAARSMDLVSYFASKVKERDYVFARNDQLKENCILFCMNKKWLRDGSIDHVPTDLSGFAYAPERNFRLASLGLTVEAMKIYLQTYDFKNRGHNFVVLDQDDKTGIKEFLDVNRFFEKYAGTKY